MYTSLNCSHCSISIALPFPSPKGIDIEEFAGLFNLNAAKFLL